MAVDKSNGSHRGRVYVVLPIKENGNGKAVIQLSFSDNQGTTWSTPRTISIANGRQNWFPWVVNDDTNGNIYIIYYSLDGAAGFSTNTYVAESDDGGATFTNKLVSDVAHTTAPIAGFGGGYSGDYIGITAYGGKAYAAWTDNRSGQWQNYVSQVVNVSITGDNSFCTTSNNYTLTNLPTGATVQWQGTPAGIVTINSPNATQTTLTAQNSGQVTLTATITTGCGTPAIISKLIPVGAPTSQTSTLTFSTTGVSNQVLQDCNELTTQVQPNTWSGFVNINEKVATSWLWTLTSKGATTAATIFNNGTTNVEFWIKPQGGYAFYSLKLANGCGFYTHTYEFTGNVVCLIQAPQPETSEAFSVSPNPAQNLVTVSGTRNETKNLQSNSDQNINARTSSQNLIYRIKITDQLGTLRKAFDYKSGINSTQVSVFGLIPGSYLISIFDGSKWKSKQLIIEK